MSEVSTSIASINNADVASIDSAILSSNSSRISDRPRPLSRDGLRSSSGRGRNLRRRANPLPDTPSFPNSPPISLPPSPEHMASNVGGVRVRTDRSPVFFASPPKLPYSPRVPLPQRASSTRHSRRIAAQPLSPLSPLPAGKDLNIRFQPPPLAPADVPPELPADVPPELPDLNDDDSSDDDEDREQIDTIAGGSTGTISTTNLSPKVTTAVARNSADNLPVAGSSAVNFLVTNPLSEKKRGRPRNNEFGALSPSCNDTTLRNPRSSSTRKVKKKTKFDDDVITPRRFFPDVIKGSFCDASLRDTITLLRIRDYNQDLFDRLDFTHCLDSVISHLFPTPLLSKTVNIPISYRFNSKKIREFQFRLGAKDQLKTLQIDSELYFDPREQILSDPSFHPCRGLTLEYIRGQNYSTDISATQKGFGFLVRNSIRDFADTVASDSKVWQHDSEVTGTIKNSHTSETEILCRRNFQKPDDTLLDQFGFCHVSCDGETDDRYSPCEKCGSKLKPFMRRCSNSVKLRHGDVDLKINK